MSSEALGLTRTKKKGPAYLGFLLPQAVTPSPKPSQIVKLMGGERRRPGLRQRCFNPAPAMSGIELAGRALAPLLDITDELQRHSRLPKRFHSRLLIGSDPTNAIRLIET